MRRPRVVHPMDEPPQALPQRDPVQRAQGLRRRKLGTGGRNRMSGARCPEPAAATIR